MKVSIIGHGFVGKALENGLKEKVETLIIDPIYNNKISDLNEFAPEIIFICVPTPMSDDGHQNINILNNVVEEINEVDINPQIVVKSTILPSNLLRIKKLIPNVIYNPEFLTERNAFEDFINSELIIFGGNINDTKNLSIFYKNYTKCKTKEHIMTDLISSSLIKYTINSFLASKVIFFNEIFNLFNKSQSSETWMNFINAISKDTRIGYSHMLVPGPDGRLGFGGACFPKDTEAFLVFFEENKKSFSLLAEAIKVNNNLRRDYSDLLDREREQNITFKSGKGFND